MHRSVLAPTLAVVLATACERDRASQPVARREGSVKPDELPALVSADLPFRYPAAVYARRLQGNVTLRLFIDRDGRVLSDSTRVETPSGVAAFDSAAVVGARELRFVPAKLHGEPVAMAILFPVYFRHPEARPLPGDTIFGASTHGSADA